MKFLIGIFLVFLASFAHAADLSVRVQGAPADGTLVFQVYDSPSTFGDFRDPVKEIRAPIQIDEVNQIYGLPAGSIVVLVYVDKNENNLLDNNFIGIPKEPLGISNNYRPKGPPAFARANFSISEDESASINIEVYKVLGELGHLGVGARVIGRSSPYIGSDTTVLQPIPAITYNGKRLQWLSPNVQYALAETRRWRLAASASYRIGVYEENDNVALSGLGGRDSTVMAGLGFRYKVLGGVNLLLRYEHDVLNKIGGGAATAKVSKGFQAGWLRIAPQLQLDWLSADLTNYDFGVPTYEPGNSTGYEAGVSSFIELTEDWRIIVSLSAEFLPDEISNSPMVTDDRIVKGFAAITFVF